MYQWMENEPEQWEGSEPRGGRFAKPLYASCGQSFLPNFPALSNQFMRSPRQWEEWITMVLMDECWKCVWR